MEPVLDDFNEENEATDTDQEPGTDTDRTDGEEMNTTPSQSRSSSIRPQQGQQLTDNDVDVFDGYSFKGRHSMVLDDDEEDNSDEGSEESMEDDDPSVLSGEHHNAEASATSLVSNDVSQEDALEPKTPEARPAALPPVVEAEPAEPTEELTATEVQESTQTEEPAIQEDEVPTRRTSKDVSSAAPVSAPAEPAASSKEASGRSTPPVKVAPNRQVANLRGARSRREKSGVPALDRYLSDAVDEDTEVTEAEHEEDEDWDFIEAADGEDRNGAKGTSLFARGVVDRYRLAVFRKASTPGTSRNGQRSVSGMSAASTATAISGADSPSPVQKRGRNAGFNLRKTPRQFLRPKSPPPSSFSKSARSVSQSASASNTISSTSIGLLSPSLSLGSNLNLGTPHSLKSKESAISVGAQSHSSDQSYAQSAVFVDAADAIRGSPQSNGADPKLKTKKLKKYKNNAEKVFSIFSSSSSPRQSTN